MGEDPDAMGRSSDGMIRSASPALAECGIAVAKNSEARKTNPDDNRVRLLVFMGYLAGENVR
jgi:hypothetical protein